MTLKQLIAFIILLQAFLSKADLSQISKSTISPLEGTYQLHSPGKNSIRLSLLLDPISDTMIYTVSSLARTSLHISCHNPNITENNQKYWINGSCSSSSGSFHSVQLIYDPETEQISGEMDASFIDDKNQYSGTSTFNLKSKVDELNVDGECPWESIEGKYEGEFIRPGATFNIRKIPDKNGDIVLTGLLRQPNFNIQYKGSIDQINGQIIFFNSKIIGMKYIYRKLVVKCSKTANEINLLGINLASNGPFVKNINLTRKLGAVDNTSTF